MKKHLYLFLLLISLLHPGFAQQQALSNHLRMALNQRDAAGQVFHLLVQGNIQQLQQLQSTLAFTLHYSAGNIASISCKSQALFSLVEQGTITYAELPAARKQILNDTMLARNRVKMAKLWTAPLPRAYNGEGVLMGIIDSGTDFSHPDLQDSTGKTRIKSMWDQRYNSGSTVPSPFNYGIEWSESQINNNQCTHTDFQYYGHGTHVTGIAAGNGLANGTHQGIASKSDLLIVALDFSKNGPTIADAVHYILTKAAALQKPCVINASVGDYYGSHDGTDLEAKLIENMVSNKPGVAMVSAAGNAGGYAFHTTTKPNNDTLFTWIKNGNNLTYWCYGDTMQMKQLHFTVGANRSNFSNLGHIGFHSFSYGLQALQSDTLKQGNKRIGIVKTSASVNNYGVCEWMVQINADTNNLFWRIETTGTGEHQAWNFNLVANNLPSTTLYPRILKYQKPDTLSTLVSGFQCSPNMITVGNYVNLSNYYDYNNVLQSSGAVGGQRFKSSSMGPTRTGIIKPDIYATGHSVFSCVALGLKAGIIANSPNTLAKGGMHVQGGGTSAAAPVVAGLAALYLQRYPTATIQEVKEAIQTCAYTDGYTGTSVPNNAWGYGKLDGKSTLYCREGVYNQVLQNTSEPLLIAFPNPFSNSCTVQFNRVLNGLIRVYNPQGQCILSTPVASDQYTLNSLPYCPGLWLVQIVSDNQSYTLKLIRE